MKIGLVGVVLSTTLVTAQRPVPVDSAVKGIRQPQAAAKAALAIGRSMIAGMVIDHNAVPLPAARVRLRNLETKRIEEATTTNHAGEFTFVVLPDTPYVVELADQTGRILAVGDVVTAQAGEIAGGLVQMPARLPALGGIFGDTAGSVISAVSSAGLTSPPLSPEK
jgi:hypothetical protein